MIAWHRVRAVMTRSLYFERRNVVRMTEFFYWPLFDIAIWGLTGLWIESNQAGPSNLALMLLTGLVLWQVVLRSSYEISLTMMEELWSRSMVNLFATPLQIHEWLLAALCNSIAKMLVVLMFGGGVVFAFYGLNIFSIGFQMAPLIFLLLLSGWTLGLLSGSITIRIGQRVGSTPWILGYLFMPFTGVFYPIESLPNWMQHVSSMLPTSYVFEAMRQLVIHGVMPWSNLGISLCLNVVYLSLTAMLFFYNYKKSCARGLSRLE